MTETEFKACGFLTVLKTLRMGFSSKSRTLKRRYLPVHVYIGARCPAPILVGEGLGLDKVAIPQSDPRCFSVSQDTMKLTDLTLDLQDPHAFMKGVLRLHGIPRGVPNGSRYLCVDISQTPCQCHHFSLDIYLVYPNHVYFGSCWCSALCLCWPDLHLLYCEF